MAKDKTEVKAAEVATIVENQEAVFAETDEGIAEDETIERDPNTGLVIKVVTSSFDTITAGMKPCEDCNK